MKRADMHTGDLVAWRDFKNGYADPGVIIIPQPVDTQYGGRYKLSRNGGAQYLLLSIKEHENGRAVRRILDGRVEADGTSGADFWGLGNVVLEHAERVREQLEAGEVVTSDDCPENWTLSRVTGSLIRGSYVEHHRADVEKRRGLQQRADEDERARIANRTRLDKIKERLVVAELPSGMTDRVEFRGWKPTEVNPLVDVPLSLLEMLLDDGDRFSN